MLKQTLNNLKIPDCILILEFIAINYCMFKSTALSLIIFFGFNKFQKTWQKQFMKPQNLRDCDGPWLLRHLFTNHSKLVNSIPELELEYINQKG